jgi:CRP/FNR family cyclic AMP-dependent transcriptional regulator
MRWTTIRSGRGSAVIANGRGAETEAVMSLASVNVFKNMTSAELSRPECGSLILEPRDGAAICDQGDPSGSVYAISGGDGHIRIGAMDRLGEALMVEVHRAGEIFGEIGMLAQRLRRTYELFQDAAFETLKVRLARQELYLAASEGRATQQGLRLTHRLRQADLADLLGATTRSIITILNAWRTAGLVVYDTDRALLTVKDIAAMRAIVEANQKR